MEFYLTTLSHLLVSHPSNKIAHLLHVVDELLGEVAPEAACGAPEVAPEVLLLPVAVVGATRPLEIGLGTWFNSFTKHSDINSTLKMVSHHWHLKLALTHVE